MERENELDRFYENPISETWRGCIDSPQTGERDKPQQYPVPLQSRAELGLSGDTSRLRLCSCESCSPIKRAKCGKPKLWVERYGFGNYGEMLRA